MYKWFLVRRYLHTKLIAVFGILSVMLCVAMVLVVMSVMGGFLDTVRARSRGLHSEIVLDNGTMQGFPYYAEFSEHLAKTLPQTVRITTPVVRTYGIFRVPRTNYTKPVAILGIDLDKYVQVNDFKRGLFYEKYYPGTTKLGPQQMPVGGVSESGEIRLPPDHEEAHRNWRESQTDPAAIAEFESITFGKAFYPDIRPPGGPAERVFAIDSAAPGYKGEELPGIIVGCDVINVRRIDGNFDRFYARGADVALTLLPLSPAGNPTGEPPVRLPMRYVDDSRTGIFEIDELHVYVDVQLLQHYLAMDAQELAEGGFTRPRINQLLISLQPGVELNAAKTEITEAWKSFQAGLDHEPSGNDQMLLSYVEVYTWEDLQRQFIQAVEKEKVLITILFGLMGVVAIMLIGLTFYMIVEKKTKDIGILKALGASGRGVAGLFIAYAAAVGVVGSLLGVGLACVFVWNINDIQDALAQLNPQLRVWSPEIYSFDRIPEVVKRADAIWVAAVAVLASMVGSIIPATVAGRVWPVKALRYE